MFLISNKFGHGVVRKVLHRLYQSVPYIISHGFTVHVISCTPLRKLWSSVRQFLRNSCAQNNGFQVANTEFHTSRKIHVESTDTRVFTPLSRVWLSLPPFTKLVNAERHHVKFFCAEIHPHRSRNMEIHLRFEVKYDSYRAHFHDTHACSTKFCKQICQTI